MMVFVMMASLPYESERGRLGRHLPHAPCAAVRQIWARDPLDSSVGEACHPSACLLYLPGNAFVRIRMHEIVVGSGGLSPNFAGLPLDYS